MDYGHLFKVMKSIEKSKKLELLLVATCMHLSPAHGNTYKKIKEDGFKVSKKIECLLSSDSSIGIAKSVGLATVSFAEVYSDLKPDMILIMGDRFEILAAVQAALFAKIPVAHIGGGDSTEGAFDESIRHSITKMSHIHFVTNHAAYKRVCQLGEDPSKVFNFGSPTIDYILDNEYISKAELESIINFKFLKNNFLFTYHPVTLSNSSNEHDIKKILLALEHFSDTCGIIITKSNADNGGHLINSFIDEFASCHENVISYNSLGQFIYYNLLNTVDFMIGNSSSGLYEMPSFNKPTINIGNRQKARERSVSIFDTKVETKDIISSIEKALAFKKTNVVNPYGSGNTSEKIIEVLENIELSNNFLQKEFHNYYSS